MAENKWFKFAVVETRKVSMVYTIRAPTEEAAREKIGRGEGFRNREGIPNVLDREVLEQVEDE